MKLDLILKPDSIGQMKQLLYCQVDDLGAMALPGNRDSSTKMIEKNA